MLLPGEEEVKMDDHTFVLRVTSPLRHGYDLGAQTHFLMW